MTRTGHDDIAPPTDEECREVLASLDDVPEPWMAVAEGRRTPEEAFPEEPALWSQLAPLPEDVRDRMVDRVVELCRPAARPDPHLAVAPRPLSPRTRWIPWAASLAAAAILLVTFVPRLMMLSQSESADHVLAGEVRAFSAQRGTSNAELRVDRNTHFYLQCRAVGRSTPIRTIWARPVGSELGARALGFTEEPDPNVMHVLADLQPGIWDVTCGVVDPDTGQFSWLEPGTRLRVV